MVEFTRTVPLMGPYPVMVLVVKNPGRHARDRFESTPGLPVPGQEVC